MTGLVVAFFAGAVLIALMVLAARDAFRQASADRWTESDDFAVMRLLHPQR